MEYSSKSLDHLGIVAGVCKEIELAAEIDRIVGIDKRQKVTTGESVEAMILNALGFVSKPLYLFPEFMKTKPVELLIGEHLSWKDFNDDTLGRSLDRLYETGTEETFLQIAVNAYKKYGFKGRFLHHDTTTFSVQGEYEHEEGDLDAVPIKVTYGHSKDNRPDLKQFVTSLIMSKELPLFIQTLSGNASDKNHFREIAKNYGNFLKESWDKNCIWVWDSAFYSKDNLKAISKDHKWITRVPETLSDAKELLKISDLKDMNQTSLDGYSLLSTEITYGVKQRWIVVFSQKAYERESKTLKKSITKEREAVEKQLWHFSNDDFYCKEDALQALQEIAREWKYHKVKNIAIQESRKKKEGIVGRPKKNDVLKIMCSVTANFEEDSEKIKKVLFRKGKFILATNDDKMSDEEVLKTYKDQQSVERGFRFLKDPLFFAHSIFLKNESRIIALVMVMGLALMIYSIAQRKLREALLRENQAIPDQTGKPTKKPTMRRVFQVFEGITVLYENEKRVMIMNLNDMHRKILSLFGNRYERIYCA